MLLVKQHIQIIHKYTSSNVYKIPRYIVYVDNNSLLSLSTFLYLLDIVIDFFHVYIIFLFHFLVFFFKGMKNLVL